MLLSKKETKVSNSSIDVYEALIIPKYVLKWDTLRNHDTSAKSGQERTLELKSSGPQYWVDIASAGQAAHRLPFVCFSLLLSHAYWSSANNQPSSASNFYPLENPLHLSVLPLWGHYHHPWISISITPLKERSAFLFPPPPAAFPETMWKLSLIKVNLLALRGSKQFQKPKLETCAVDISWHCAELRGGKGK